MSSKGPKSEDESSLRLLDLVTLKGGLFIFLERVVHNSWISFTLSRRTSPERTGCCGTGACVSSASLRRRTRRAARDARIHRKLRSSRGAPYRPTAAAGSQRDGFPKATGSALCERRGLGTQTPTASGTLYCTGLIVETLGGKYRVSCFASTRSYSAILFFFSADLTSDFRRGIFFSFL